MGEVVHFNMVVEMNEMLRKKGIEYSVHTVGGCSCCGLELRQDGKEFSREAIIEMMNEYLSHKWMRVKQDQDNPTILNIESKFDFEK